jgi:hypothetical protein
MHKPQNIMATMGYIGFCLVFGGSIGYVRRRWWHLFKMCHHFGVFLFIIGVRPSRCSSSGAAVPRRFSFPVVAVKLSQRTSTTMGSILGSRHWYIGYFSPSHFAIPYRLSRRASIFQIYHRASAERTLWMASRSERTNSRPYGRYGARGDLGEPSVYVDDRARGLGRRRCEISCQGRGRLDEQVVRRCDEEEGRRRRGIEEVPRVSRRRPYRGPVWYVSFLRLRVSSF